MITNIISLNKYIQFENCIQGHNFVQWWTKNTQINIIFGCMHDKLQNNKTNYIANIHKNISIKFAWMERMHKEECDDEDSDKSNLFMQQKKRGMTKTITLFHLESFTFLKGI